MGNWQELLDRFKLPIGSIFVGIILMAAGTFLSAPKKEFPKESLIQSTRMIKIDLSGQVKNPGVYELEEGKRIQDVLDLAGGFTNEANQEYISKRLNLAQKLTDGSKLYIPKIDEKGEDLSISSTASSKQVNINSSSQEALEALPGIGVVTASKIIEGRPYQKIEDLVSKKILSKSTFEKIKNNLVVY